MILKYGVPFLLALVIHFLVFFFVDKNWDGIEEPSAYVDLNTIKAELITIEPTASPQYDSVEPASKTANKMSQTIKDRPQLKTPALPKEIEVKEAQPKTNAKDSEDQPVLNKELLADLSKTGFESTLQQEAMALNESTSRQIASSFQAKIYNQVRNNWSRPPSARNGMQTKLLVELIPTGEVMSVSIIESSGVLAFDRSAEQAIKRSGKFEVPDNNQLFEEYFRRFYFLFKPEDLLR